MGNDTHSMAMVWGLLVTVLMLIAAIVWIATDDNPPTERRALRVGIISGIVSAALVVLCELTLYYSVYQIIGAFMIVPSIAFALLVLWFVGRTVYFGIGGGQEVEKPQSTLIEIEQETLENQGNIWCRLRELPHFRETLGGQLINMATGDRLYWIDLNEQKCIEIKLAGATVIIGSRYETLTKYLAVQTGLSKMLGLITVPLQPSASPAVV